MIPIVKSKSKSKDDQLNTLVKQSQQTKGGEDVKGKKSLPIGQPLQTTKKGSGTTSMLPLLVKGGKNKDNKPLAKEKGSLALKPK